MVTNNDVFYNYIKEAFILALYSSDQTINDLEILVSR